MGQRLPQRLAEEGERAPKVISSTLWTPFATRWTRDALSTYPLLGTILDDALAWTSSNAEGEHLTGQIILFLLFMGAEKVVNRIAKRPLMNGAAWYLVAAVIVFMIAVTQGTSAIAAQTELGAGMKAQLQGRVVGTLIGSFLLPVGAAIYYSRKFSRERETAAREASESNA